MFSRPGSVPGCDCSHQFVGGKEKEEEAKNFTAEDLQASTCSFETVKLGPHQKVIGFTYFEDKMNFDKYNRDYFSGIR